MTEPTDETSSFTARDTPEDTSEALRFERLESRIRHVMPNLTPAGQRVAQLLLDDEERASRCTISELSELSRASESTIVRTARSLGFRGYPELRLALAAEAARHGGERTVVGDITPDDELPAVIGKLASAENQAINDTAAQLDGAVLGRVIDVVINARRVNIYGTGASALVALDLQQKLERMGRICFAYNDMHMATTSAVLLTAQDVAIGVSYSGETVDVIDALEHAKEAGAHTVALTNHPDSTVARSAEHVLVPAGRETAFRPGALASRTSQLLVVDCIFVGIAQRTYDETNRALTLTHEALQNRRHRSE